MFTVCNNLNHGECVYNIIKSPPCEGGKPPMHKSKYSCMVRREVQCRKQGTRTMGPPVVPLCPPEHYLKKHSRAPISLRPPGVPKVQLFPVEVQTEPPEVDLEVRINEGGQMESSQMEQGAQVRQEPAQPREVEFDCCPPQDGGGDRPPAVVIDAKRRIPRLCCNCEKPGVPPACCMRFTIIPRGCKDYVRDNTTAVIRKPAKIPNARFVDEPKGNSQDWCKSGMARRYVFRQDYGMVPGYLVQRKMEIQDKICQEQFASEQAQRNAQEKCRHLTEEERQTLICGLKTNWESLFQMYQSLPLLIDTPMKVKKKSELEEALKCIEKDIQLLERNNHVFVADAHRTFYMS